MHCKKRINGPTIVLATVLLLGIISPYSVANAEDGTWTSDQFSISVSWESPWTEVDRRSVDGDYDSLRLAFDRVTSDFFAIESDEDNPLDILGQFVERFYSGNPSLVVEQEWSRGGASALPMIVSFEDLAGYQYKAVLFAHALDNGRGVYVYVSTR